MGLGKNRNYFRLVFKCSLRSKIKAVCGEQFLLSVRGELPEIRPFFQIFMKFNIEFIYKHLSSNRGVRENHSHNLFKDVNL